MMSKNTVLTNFLLDTLMNEAYRNKELVRGFIIGPEGKSFSIQVELIQGEQDV